MKKIFLLLALSATSFAQQPPCGLTTITETTPLLYPPIAKAAHVGGTVIFLVSFKQSGEVENIELLSGPKMLRAPASLYVNGLRVNAYGGPRTCPMVIRYVIQQDDADLRPVERTDYQHVIIYAKPLVICDPEMHIEKVRKRFWPISLHKPKQLD
ncbi:energy transducer TonB [Tunturibacter empetritectus]|uniref:Energy transducer TonB n=1 Tax=Tunturiibacter empetritectus TaxID=3069691 RepID=A0AAU7ZHX5_9BACT